MQRPVSKLIRILNTIASNPKLTLEYLKMLPSAVQGMQFSRGTAFSAKGQASGPVSETPNALLSYFDSVKEGPGIWKWLHYFDIYERHFSKFVGRDVHVMEVGIYSGGSLQMWRKFFGKNCHVYGVDIEQACMAYKCEGIEVFIGDQADRSFWARVRQAAPTIDILIDDGGHLPEQQRITLEEMLPHIRPGGVFLCEDIHCTPNHFTAYVQGIASRMSATLPFETPDGPTGSGTPFMKTSEFQSVIDSIHFYPFVAVIEKRARTLERLSAPKHGTKWEPFL